MSQFKQYNFSNAENEAVSMPESSHNASVHFVSLGCPKNLVDSQVMLGLLKNSRYHLENDPKQAEVIIVNTCSFIQASQEESIETLLEMAQHKLDGKCKVLVATGCLSQRYSKELEKEMPEVDLFIGTGQYHKVTEILESTLVPLTLGAPLPKRSYIDFPAFIHSETHARVHTGPKYTGFLKISEGCNRRCAFCIIPKLRGNVRSRSVDSLVAEATAMAHQGVIELNLVAQDLTEYGMEWRFRESLETLLPRLCEIPELHWIRLHYVYPDEFSDELIEILARQKKILKYLDMPIQHTQDNILKAMNRRLTREKLFTLIRKIRERIPEVVFRTSLIVGFPGETEKDFENLCEDMQSLKLEHVGVFRYSKEPGTRAAELPDQVHPKTKRARMRRLMEILQVQSSELNQKLIGHKVMVLVEGVSSESDLLLQGRMPTQAQEIDGHVLINETDTEQVNSGQILAGDLVEVEITESLPPDFVGKCLKVLIPARVSPSV